MAKKATKKATKKAEAKSGKKFETWVDAWRDKGRAGTLIHTFCTREITPRLAMPPENVDKANKLISHFTATHEVLDESEL